MQPMTTRIELECFSKLKKILQNFTKIIYTYYHLHLHENLAPSKSDHCITNPILSGPLPVIASPRSQCTSVAKTIPKFTASAAAVYPQPVPMSIAVRAA